MEKTGTKPASGMGDAVGPESSVRLTPWDAQELEGNPSQRRETLPRGGRAGGES